MQDYPAAHSMDTHWFAIDAEGNIGYFDSSEGGAVPETWKRTWLETRIDYICDFLDLWRQTGASSILDTSTPGDAIEDIIATADVLKLIDDANNDYDLALKRLKRYKCGEEFASIVDLIMLDKTGFYDGFTLKLATEDCFNLIAKELNGFEDCEPVIRFAGNANVFCFHAKLIEDNILLIKRLVRENQIIGIKPVHLYFSRTGNLHELGLFFYAQESGAPIPYEKRAEPIVPLRLEDLPEPLQDALSWTWFDTLRFSETTLIQPIEHMSCSTWGGRKWWIDTEGQEHDGHPHDPA